MIVDTIFWRRKSDDFLALHDESPPISAELWEDWYLRVVGDEAVYSDVRRLRKEAALEDFTILAGSAAVAYGLDTGPNAWRAWLECLSKELDYVDSWDCADDYFKRHPGVRGFIADVCEASARFCRKLAIEAEAAAIVGTRPTQAAIIDSSSEQSAGAREVENARTGPGDLNSSSDQEDACFPNRATWLAAEMKRRGMTRYRLQKVGGPDTKTIAAILAGRPVRDDVLDKVAVGLSHKGPVVSLGDIPRS